jgi:superfamily II DNA or RNA helicase
MAPAQPNPSYRVYDLKRAREARGRTKEPAAHQKDALAALDRWYQAKRGSGGGGILVLPTGGGKTFTAIRFLCVNPLSDGYKVLWLAHTHHLLEQALDGFGPLSAEAVVEAAHVHEPRDVLRARVVSGTPGHCQVKEIEASDDVLIVTLQTAARAMLEKHPRLLKFLGAAGGKLVVVFDEAHHAPAPSYSRFVTVLREKVPDMLLLGLTATPTYSDERRQGWLKKLFPQRILYQVTPNRLMADRVLARPRLEEPRTRLTPEFDEREYERWSSTYRDLPESLITQLAENQQRNDFIVDHYVANRERYRRTLIFADRWFQCDYLRERLRARGVRADVVYSHIDADPGSAEARRRRTSDDNSRVLAAFKRGKLDVLINVRMLTEGTDVPSVQTVFLTRQTTSRVLLTQMVGRALRGPAFGGTEDAYIVSFIDDWKQAINWAEYDQIGDGRADEGQTTYGRRPPLQIISIELVRRLARQMQTGRTMAAESFTTLLPLGWYRLEFQAAIEGSDESEWVRQLVMVFERERDAYERFIEQLVSIDLSMFAEEGVTLAEHKPVLEQWRQQFFSDASEHAGSDLLSDLFHIARHVAQGNGERPQFFKFEERDAHDLEAVAQKFIGAGLGPLQLNQSLMAEYQRRDRFWRSLYGTYELFYAQYQAVQLRVIYAQLRGNTSGPAVSVVDTPKSFEPREPSDAVKQAVKSRDGNRCLCCHSTRYLQVDHIAPSYLGGDHEPENLQTLCGRCNRDKRLNELNFRVHRTSFNGPRELRMFESPTGGDATSPEHWERFLRRTLNFFYGCAAVDTVKIGSRGPSFYEWVVQLFPGNDPGWLEPHIEALLADIRARRKAGRAGGAGQDRHPFGQMRRWMCHARVALRL